MWIPMLLKKLNYEDMQAQGLKLTPEQIYDINNACIKDAIVGLGRPAWGAQFNFCSGEIISGKGLFLTNHHCGYGAIQQLSSTDKNFLENGFWAMNQGEEIPAGFSVSILQSMADVTETMLKDINYETSEEEREKLIAGRLDSLKKAEEKNDSLITIVIKPFFGGNEYYLFRYLVYEDVRFVGAPPSSIGKYGGDTDNWMWPRHTGDFSMFRIYADEDNNPAAYSESNVPYSPKHFLPISLKGIKKDDYAMIFGFPGSTDRFLTSYGVELALNIEQPAIVKLRRIVLDAYEEGMAKSDATRLQYAAKHSGVSNYWKYFKGQMAGLKRLNVYNKKKAEEDKFSQWISSNGMEDVFGNVLNDFETAYDELAEYQLVSTYLNEAIYRVEMLKFSRDFAGLLEMLNADEQDEEAISKVVESLKTKAVDHFKDYNAEIDRKVLIKLIERYHEDIPETQQPEYELELVHKNKHNFKEIGEDIFDDSMFASLEDVMDFLEKPKAKYIEKDPAFQLITSIRTKYFDEYLPKLREISQKLDIANRLFIDGLRQMNEAKIYYPDANSTMRVSYGKVDDYYPRDAVYYNYFTTLDGVMEKEDPSNHEFIVDERLKKLYEKKDYGRYANEDGELVVNFISGNDITGGNSGSPVINANGELIGTAFDGNWEAMSGDIAFEPELQRTISVDIRYTLFLIDKLAHAGYLLDEMKIVE